MKIFQPTISSSAYIEGLTSTAQSNVVTINISTGQLFYTASSAFGGGGGGGNTFPYTGDAVISGSLTVTGSLITTGSIVSTLGFTGSLLGTASFTSTASYSNNFTIGSTLTLDGSLTDYASVISTIVGSNNLFNQATGSYTAALGKYTIYKGTNARAGEFMTVWNDALTPTYTDTSTPDIGNTSDITFSSTLVGGNVQINAGAASSGWTVKMLITYL